MHSWPCSRRWIWNRSAPQSRICVGAGSRDRAREIKADRPSERGRPIRRSDAATSPTVRALCRPQITSHPLRDQRLPTESDRLATHSRCLDHQSRTRRDAQALSCGNKLIVLRRDATHMPCRSSQRDPCATAENQQLAIFRMARKTQCDTGRNAPYFLQIGYE
jgi:hypothetical protein